MSKDSILLENIHGIRPPPYTGTDGITSQEPEKIIKQGFCFDCDKPVETEWISWWAVWPEDSGRCLECGSSNVAFIGPFMKRVWDKITEIETLMEGPMIHSL